MPTLTHPSVTAAITDLAARSPIAVRTQIDPLGCLPPAVEAAAYSVVAEALTNAATHALVHLARSPGSLHVLVIDDRGTTTTVELPC